MYKYNVYIGFVYSSKAASVSCCSFSVTRLSQKSKQRVPQRVFRLDTTPFR